MEKECQRKKAHTHKQQNNNANNEAFSSAIRLMWSGMVGLNAYAISYSIRLENNIERCMQRHGTAPITNQEMRCAVCCLLILFPIFFDLFLFFFFFFLLFSFFDNFSFFQQEIPSFPILISFIQIVNEKKVKRFEKDEREFLVLFVPSSI